MIREPVAISSWVVLAAISLVPDRLRSHASSADPALTAVAFFLAAAATRYWLRETRSREQILAFVAVAVVLALVRLLVPGRAMPLTGLLLSVSSAVAGVLVVKVWLEGMPF